MDSISRKKYGKILALIIGLTTTAGYIYNLHDDDTAHPVLSNVKSTSLHRPERIVQVAEGMFNKRITNLVPQLKLSHQQKINRLHALGGNQYLIAMPLVIGPNNDISGSPDVSMYYENLNSTGLQISPDIDDESIQCMEGIQTKIESECRIEDGGKKKKRFHTELQFLCGKHFHKELRSEHAVFLIYSHFIPCSGLSSCSYGECAGDMAYHRHMHKNVHFIVLYAELFKPGGEDTGSNEKLSKLYLTLAGIPLLKCTESCEPTPADQALPLEELIQNPIFHRFPRVFKKGKTNENRTKAVIFAECLARGTFIQELSETHSNLSLHDISQTDGIMTEFTKEYFLERCQEANTTKCTFNQFLKHHAAGKRDHGNSSDMMKLNLRMCLLYMDALPSNYSDNKLELDGALKKRLVKKDKFRIRNKLCKTFGIKILSKGKVPHICKN